MLFADGTKRAGIFEQNLFIKTLKNSSDIDPFREVLEPACIVELETFLEEQMQRFEEKKVKMRNKSLDRTNDRSSTIQDTDNDVHSVNRRLGLKIQDKDDKSMKAQVA